MYTITISYVRYRKEIAQCLTIYLPIKSFVLLQIMVTFQVPPKNFISASLPSVKQSQSWNKTLMSLCLTELHVVLNLLMKAVFYIHRSKEHFMQSDKVKIRSNASRRLGLVTYPSASVPHSVNMCFFLPYRNLYKIIHILIFLYPVNRLIKPFQISKMEILKLD